MTMREVFGLRLRQYAVRMNNIQNALIRLNNLGIKDNSYSPSGYTPNRNECIKALEEIDGTIRGYCFAVDDAIGIELGYTKIRFFEAYEKKLYEVQPYECPDNDSGYSFAHDEAESKADESFTKFLFQDI